MEPCRGLEVPAYVRDVLSGGLEVPVDVRGVQRRKGRGPRVLVCFGGVFRAAERSVWGSNTTVLGPAWRWPSRCGGVRPLCFSFNTGSLLRCRYMQE
jgi:hypothetical protein